MIFIYLYRDLSVGPKGSVDADSADLCRLLKTDLVGQFALSERSKKRTTKKVFPLSVQLGEPFKERQGGEIMDFSTWSPSYTNIAIFVAVMFFAQVVVLLYRTGRLEKRLSKQSDDLRRLHNQLEGRIDQGIDDFNQPVVGIRKELSDVRIAISKMNQNPIKYLTHDNQVLEGQPEPRKSHTTV